MSVRPYRDIYRRRSRQINVGPVKGGGDAPISVQSMTNTPTTDVEGTIAQVRALEAAGADNVRISCPDRESTEALARIVPHNALREPPPITETSSMQAPASSSTSLAMWARPTGNIQSRVPWTR